MRLLIIFLLAALTYRTVGEGTDDFRNVLNSGLNILKSYLNEEHFVSYNYYIPSVDQDEEIVFSYRHFSQNLVQHYSNYHELMKRNGKKFHWQKCNWIFAITLGENTLHFLFTVTRNVDEEENSCRTGVRINGTKCLKLVNFPCNTSMRRQRMEKTRVFHKNQKLHPRVSTPDLQCLKNGLLPQVLVTKAAGIKEEKRERTYWKYVNSQFLVASSSLDVLLNEMPKLKKMSERQSIENKDSFFWTNKVTRSSCPEGSVSISVILSAQFSLYNVPLAMIHQSRKDYLAYYDKYASTDEIREFVTYLENLSSLTSEYGPRAREKILNSLQEICDNDCYHEMNLYLDAILLEHDKVLLWDYNQNCIADANEVLSLSEIARIIEKCKGKKIKIFTTREIQENWKRLTKPGLANVEFSHFNQTDNPRGNQKMSVWPLPSQYIFKSHIKQAYRRFQRSLHTGRTRNKRFPNL